ncbi:hypothetical protein B0A50_08709 [Salinomyces thailandicus]|uniref:Beta-lactamase/transpeptidase-like protein n=1 Tax=Salinomyces thailandicus TaxID=706561 RepID=A0A4U0TIX3_9PEZI|nr:hypothetical protein B0A50_08709 [Salinomyces thailandica]
MRLLASFCFAAPTPVLAKWLDFLPQQPLSNPHDTHQPFTKDLDTFINATMTEFLTPGMSIAIVNANTTSAKGYGYANLATQEPMTPRTLFLAGSTTKSFTATAISQLVYSNASDYADIDWTTKLVALLREDFVLQDEYATNHISLIDALSHRTGMPRHDTSWVNQPGPVDLKERVRQLRYLPLHRELREAWEYCNLMFHVVAHALETVTRSSMTELLRNRIWKPLGMLETFFDLTDALAYAESSDEVTMATGYLYDNLTSHSYVAVPWSDLPPADGAGGVVSNVQDYTRWIQTFLNPFNTSSPVSAEAIEMMTSAHMPRPATISPYAGGKAWYGLGLEGGVYKDVEVIGHGGAINGYMTAMYWIPEREFGVVIMQNTYSLAPNVVLWKIIDDFLETAEAERYDMAGAARKMQAEKLAEMDQARNRLYPERGDLDPALPLPEYEGRYTHPAYHNFTISRTTDSSPQDGDGLGASPRLQVTPSVGAYGNISATMHHVSGEHWLTVTSMGPAGSWLTDEAVKARFEVGVKGKVTGLWLQVEPAIPDMALLERVA